MSKYNFEKNNLLNEFYYTTKLPNGLNIVIYPKKGFDGLRISASVKFGKCHSEVWINDSKELFRIPAGTAHFLEHMIFYDDLGNSYMKKISYMNAKTNGYTCFDHTVYSVETCEKEFSEILKCFLDMIFNFGFTEQNLQSERTVIQQEKSEDNDSMSEVMYASFENAYESDGVKDCFGNVYEVSKDILVKCYNLFYHPQNMFITAIGDFDIEKFMSILEEFFDNKVFPEFKSIQFIQPKTPINMKTRNIIDDTKLNIQACIILRMPTSKLYEKCKNKIHIQLVIEFLCSYLFDELGGVVRSSFSNSNLIFYNNFEMNDNFAYLAIAFECENWNYTKILSKILETIKKVAKNGISDKDFFSIKKGIYACALSDFDSYYDLSETIIESYYYGFTFEEYLKELISFSVEDFASTLDEILKNGKILQTVVSSE